jgi:hypothetical protein
MTVFDSSGALVRSAILLLLSLVVVPGAQAETAADHAVQLGARLSFSPPSIRLVWRSSGDARSYEVSRKQATAAAWEKPVSLPASASQYTDARAVVGVEYEYRVVKVAAPYRAFGYLSAALQRPLVIDRGQLLLLVEASLAQPLAPELSRLERDLAGDGWFIRRRDVGRTLSPAAVKSVILRDAAAAGGKLKALFLFGHVPVPYSGNYSPDEHPDHVGAWPADGYYGTLTGRWTDATVNNTKGVDPRTRNVPGDGKFDQGTFPGPVALEIGRVDLANLTSFEPSEVELYRRYLNKNHAYRHRQFAADPNGLVADQFGVGRGEAFAAGAWSSYAALLGAGSVIASDNFFPAVEERSYTFAYAGGGGSYTNIGSLVFSSQYAHQTSRAVFTGFFGSYLGDWDSWDNLMRASLANTGPGLAAMWNGRPRWYLHPLGQGHTLGSCARMTQNNQALYAPGRFARGVHIALLGDPTLRLHPVAPPAELQAAPGGASVRLTWQAPAEPVEGYHVLRARSESGPFERLTKAIVRGLSFTDPAPLPGPATYQVRAVRVEVSNSGSYWNSSQGIFATIE